MKIKASIAGFVLCTGVATASVADTNGPAIIPLPQKMELRAGTFTLTPDTPIYVDPASRETENVLTDRLRRSTGYPLKTRTKFFSSAAIKGGILLTTKDARTNLGAEGYDLTVAPDSVVIRAPTQTGLFYGVQTLLQLLPPEIFSTNRVTNVD
jgi:hexosaminidase